MPSINTFLPGAVSSDFDTRNHFLNYKRDPNTPKHQIRWNFIVEVPIGHGKKLLPNKQSPFFEVFFLCALLPWNWCATAVTGTMASIVNNGHLIKKVYFPREVLVIASVNSWAF